MSNLKLFVELLWDFLSSACFHSRISTLQQRFLLVFGNKRRIFAKVEPFLGDPKPFGGGGGCLPSGRVESQNSIKEQEPSNRSYKRRAV